MIGEIAIIVMVFLIGVLLGVSRGNEYDQGFWDGLEWALLPELDYYLWHEKLIRH